jgi:hypothetical protein
VHTGISIDIKKINFIGIKQSSYRETPNNIFITEIRKKRENELALGCLLDMKDAGINYQRVNVGLSDKGNSDLSTRLFYEGKKENTNDREYWKGTDINSYFLADKTSRYVRRNIMLHNNERVILNEAYFKIKPKLLWRQTASYPVTVIDTKGVWFGRSIQAGIIKKEYRKTVSYEFLCALLNSKYLRHLYTNIVKEEGRIFPQVKLEKLKTLPVIIPKNQKPYIAFVNKIIILHTDLLTRRQRFLRRLTGNFTKLKITETLEQFDELDFNQFLAELWKQKIKVVFKKQDELEEYFIPSQTECRDIMKQIADTDTKIDKMVYELYGLSEEEIKIIEKK